MTSAHHADSDRDATIISRLPRGHIACVVRYYDAAPTHRAAIIDRLHTLARARRIQLFVSVMHGHRLPRTIKTIHISSWYKARHGIVSSWRRAHHTATTSSTSIHSVSEWTIARKHNHTYALISPINTMSNKKAMPRATRAAILAASVRHNFPRLLALGGITNRTPIDKRFYGRAMRRGFTSPRNAPITKPS